MPRELYKINKHQIDLDLKEIKQFNPIVYKWIIGILVSIVILLSIYISYDKINAKRDACYSHCDTMVMIMMSSGGIRSQDAVNEVAGACKKRCDEKN